MCLFSHEFFTIYREPTSTINLYMPDDPQNSELLNMYKLSFHKGYQYIKIIMKTFLANPSNIKYLG